MTDTELLELAKHGRLSADQIEDVATALRATPSGRDPYTLIHILGRSGAVWHRELVAKFLESPSDPMLARISLQVLCSHWGLSNDYAGWIEKFILGVEWDSEEDVRVVATSLAGELLRTNQSHRLKDMLLRIFMDARESRILRQAAYFALARASGRSWDELPPASRAMDLDKDTDPAVLTWARAGAEDRKDRTER